MNSTARFALPLLAAGQAQKEMSVNEAMTLLDALVQASAESAGNDTPPGDPLPGQCWIVGSSPAGVWAGASQKLAVWTEGGWRFVQAREGFAVYLRSNGLTARFEEGTWRTGAIAAAEIEIGGQRVIGPRQPAVADPSGGAVVDTEARAAIAAILSAFRSHGLIAA